MKKKLILLIFLLLLIQSNAFCETDEFDAGYDAFTRIRNLKPVSEQEVQQVLKTLEERKKLKAEKKHWWQKSKTPKKMEGASLSKQGSDSNNDNVIQKPYLLIQVTDKLLGANSIIEPGFYTPVFNKETGNLTLKQGYKAISEIKMYQTPTEQDIQDLYYIKTKRENNGVKFFYGEVEKHYEGFCQIIN